MYYYYGLLEFSLQIIIMRLSKLGLTNLYTIKSFGCLVLHTHVRTRTNADAQYTSIFTHTLFWHLLCSDNSEFYPSLIN